LTKHVKFKLCTSQNFKDDTENNIEPSMISHKTTGERIEKRNRQVTAEMLRVDDKNKTTVLFKQTLILNFVV